MLNPGEAFAETYRVLNEQKLGLPQEAWTIVTHGALLPTRPRSACSSRTCSTPWTANTTAKTFTAKLTGQGPHEDVHGRTPYDGTIGVVPRQVGRRTGQACRCSRTAHRSNEQRSSARVGPSLSTTVCGVRSYRCA